MPTVLGGSLEQRYRIVRNQLDNLGYEEAFPVDALSLIERLVIDLINTKESLRSTSKNAEHYYKVAESLQFGVEPFKDETIRLCQENNELKLQLYDAQKKSTKIISENKLLTYDLEDENKDLKIVINQLIEQSNVRYKQQIKEGVRTFSENQIFDEIHLNTEGERTKTFALKLIMEVSCDAPSSCPYCIRIRNYVQFCDDAYHENPSAVDYIKIADSRIECLQLQCRKYKDERKQLILTMEKLKRKLEDSKPEKSENDSKLTSLWKGNREHELEMSLKASQMQSNILQKRNIDLERKFRDTMLAEGIDFLNSKLKPDSKTKLDNRNIIDLGLGLDYPTFDEMSAEEKLTLLEAQLSHCCEEKAKLKYLLEECEQHRCPERLRAPAPSPSTARRKMATKSTASNMKSSKVFHSSQHFPRSTSIKHVKSVSRESDKTSKYKKSKFDKEEEDHEKNKISTKNVAMNNVPKGSEEEEKSSAQTSESIDDRGSIPPSRLESETVTPDQGLLNDEYNQNSTAAISSKGKSVPGHKAVASLGKMGKSKAFEKDGDILSRKVSKFQDEGKTKSAMLSSSKHTPKKGIVPDESEKAPRPKPSMLPVKTYPGTKTQGGSRPGLHQETKKLEEPNQRDLDEESLPEESFDEGLTDEDEEGPIVPHKQVSKSLPLKTRKDEIGTKPKGKSQEALNRETKKSKPANQESLDEEFDEDSREMGTKPKGTYKLASNDRIVEDEFDEYEEAPQKPTSRGLHKTPEDEYGTKRKDTTRPPETSSLRKPGAAKERDLEVEPLSEEHIDAGSVPPSRLVSEQVASKRRILKDEFEEEPSDKLSSSKRHGRGSDLEPTTSQKSRQQQYLQTIQKPDVNGTGSRPEGTRSHEKPSKESELQQLRRESSKSKEDLNKLQSKMKQMDQRLSSIEDEEPITRKGRQEIAQDEQNYPSTGPGSKNRDVPSYNNKDKKASSEFERDDSKDSELSSESMKRSYGGENIIRLAFGGSQEEANPSKESQERLRNSKDQVENLDDDEELELIMPPPKTYEMESEVTDSDRNQPARKGRGMGSRIQPSKERMEPDGEYRRDTQKIPEDSFDRQRSGGIGSQNQKKLTDTRPSPKQSPGTFSGYPAPKPSSASMLESLTESRYASEMLAPTRRTLRDEFDFLTTNPLSRSSMSENKSRKLDTPEQKRCMDDEEYYPELSRVTSSNKELECEREVLQLRASLKSLDRDKDEMRVELDRKDEKLAMLLREATQSKDEVNRLQLKLKQAELQLSHVDGGNRDLERESSVLRRQNETLRRDLDHLARQRDEAHKELRKVASSHSLSEVEKRNMGIELQRTSKEADDLRLKLQKYIDEVRRIEELLQAKEEELESILNQYRALSEENIHLENYRSNLEIEATSFRQAARQAVEQSSNLKSQLSRQNTMVKSYEDEISRLSQQIATLETQLKNATESAMSLNKDTAVQRDYYLKLEKTLDEARLKLADTESAKKKVEADNRDLKAKITEMLATLEMEKTRAQKHENLISKTKDLEFGLQNEMKSLIAERNELLERLAALDRRNDSMDKDLSQFRMKFIETKTELERTTRQLQTERQERETAMEELRRLQEQLNTSSMNKLLSSALDSSGSTSGGTGSANTSRGNRTFETPPRTSTARNGAGSSKDKKGSGGTGTGGPSNDGDEYEPYE